MAALLAAVDIVGVQVGGTLGVHHLVTVVLLGEVGRAPDASP